MMSTVSLSLTACNRSKISMAPEGLVAIDPTQYERQEPKDLLRVFDSLALPFEPAIFLQIERLCYVTRVKRSDPQNCFFVGLATVISIDRMGKVQEWKYLLYQDRRAHLANRTQVFLRRRRWPER